MQNQYLNFLKSFRIYSLAYKYITIIVLSSCLLLFPYSLQAGNLYSINKVVIDPGHGGKDPGCLGAFTNEKTIALGIAFKLGKYIKDNFNDIEVIYTRKGDDFVESHKRTSLANNNEADLFISIHTNAGPRTAYGTESYVLGSPETDANIAVSERENLPILLEENYHDKYNGFNPYFSKASINSQFFQNPFMYQSSLLASKIQKQFKNTLHRRDRGVRQAGFVVLYKTKMPSILIEVGFLTNPFEEKFLSSTKGQDYLASAIFRGFKEYKIEMETRKRKELEARLATDYMPKEKALKQINAANSKADATNKIIAELQATLNTELKKNKNMIKHLNETIKKAKNKNGTIVALRTKLEEGHKSKNDVSVQKESNTGVSGARKKNDTVSNSDSSAKNQRIIFKVQIVMSKTSLKRNSPRFMGLKNVWEYKHHDLYKYTIGNKRDLKSAIALQSELRKKGFNDAFVVTFQNGKRRSMKVLIGADKRQHNSKS
jgi:N-acetylmuramoyl-L-alanine amidase